MTREEQAQYISEKLMENPEFRKAFVGAITDAVNEVVKVIKALQQEPCGDAISRQAVLDHIYGVNGLEGLELSNVFEKHYADFIKSLPPVKPQYTDAEIQKMQDLEFAEIQKAYEIGKAENPNKWIPVSERLPEEEGLYLVYTEEQPYVCPFDGREWRIDEVTAWMPLPEPYKASPTGEEVEE